MLTASWIAGRIMISWCGKLGTGGTGWKRRCGDRGTLVPNPVFGQAPVKRIFYIAGVRYYIGCEGEDCNKAIHLEAGNKLKLDLDPKNQYDKNAIKIIDSKGNHVGYLPRYYSESVTTILKKGARYSCIVLEVNKQNECHECVKVKLEVYTDTGEINTRVASSGPLFWQE